MTTTQSTARNSAERRMLSDLQRLVEVPSISSAPERAEQVAASARLVAEMFTEVGVPCSVVTEGGAPAVIGRREGPEGAPAVLLYAHHDVQPVVADEWEGDPFELTECPADEAGRGTRMAGRGAADDKGGIVVHLETLRRLMGSLLVTVAVLIEGEEEVASPSLERIVHRHRDLLRADVALLPDAVNSDVGVPSLTDSLRGILGIRIGVRTAERAVHSGIFGGALPDALGTLVHLLDSLVDEDGRVAVPGIVADPAPANPSAAATMAEVAAAAGTVPGLRLAGGAPEIGGQAQGGAGTDGMASSSTAKADGRRLAAELWTQPCLTVLAIDAPRVAEATNILTPTAQAVVSLRLPPSLDPQVALECVSEHLAQHNRAGAELDIVPVNVGRGWSAGSGGGGSADAVIRLALAELGQAYSQSAVTMGVGGGIPFVDTLTTEFPGLVPLITAVQDPESNAHAANESVAVDTLHSAVEAQVGILRRLGESGFRDVAGVRTTHD
ncbi:M20/M25/M40 family metallo-hydrolase [Galactobacter sp.]|uniref:M20/M25/M40 family metallo-hydrolase n=1 Tax=Galactobacter sp. TaxID=2676125 RepID=UPI0025C6A35F|nr:M20/M25/M40 family metallo-hydrolase [Galactobacter sp.]